MRPRHGFTLLEMLVVLAMLALAMGVAVPQIGRWLEAAELRGWRADLRAHLAAQPLQAFLAGEPKELDAVALRQAFPPPEGVEMRLDPDTLRYAANGSAQGGRVLIWIRGAREVWNIEPLTGHVVGATP